jgi:hypothetical protein
MGHFDRLQLVGRITYYLGWIALLCGGLVQLNIGKALFVAISLTKRNLFEVSVVLFIICLASELRALALAGSQVSAGLGKRAVAA